MKIDQRASGHVVDHLQIAAAGKCGLENHFVLQISYFVCCKLKIGPGIGEVVTKTLTVVVLSGYWISAVDVVSINIAGHICSLLCQNGTLGEYKIFIEFVTSVVVINWCNKSQTGAVKHCDFSAVDHKIKHSTGSVLFGG